MAAFNFDPKTARPVNTTSVEPPAFDPSTAQEEDGALARGYNRMKQSAAITGSLVTGNSTAAADKIAESASYNQRNRGSKAKQELGAAWDKGDGVMGGIKGVAGEITKDWRESKGFVGGARSLAENVGAMGEGVLEQLPNSIPSMGGMAAGALAGGLAGSAVPGVGNAAGVVLGGWAGATAGNTAVEGGGMAMDAIQKAGINPQDRAAVKAYLDQNGDQLLGQATTKGAIIGAVDTATMGLGSALLKAPAKAAAGRVLTEMGVNLADQAAVKTAMATPEFAAKMATDAAYKAATTGARGFARNAGVAALEPTGEFAGEYLGQGVATGDWNAKEATLEALSSIGQSAGTFGVQKGWQLATQPGGIINRSTKTDQPAAAPDAATDLAQTPLGLGYNPQAGAHTVFQDGSIVLNSDSPAGEQAVFDKRYAPQPVKPSEAMGLNPDAGPISAAATLAVDSGATDQVQQEQTLANASERDQQLYQQETDYQRSKQGVADRRRAAIEGMLERAAIQGDGARTAPTDDSDIQFGDDRGQPDATRGTQGNTGAASRLAGSGSTQADAGRVSGAAETVADGQPQRFPALTGQQPTSKATTGQKVKSLKELIALKKAEREAKNVQNAPQGTDTGATVAQAPTDQAPQAVGSQPAGTAAGVSAAGSTGVEAAGVASDGLKKFASSVARTGTGSLADGKKTIQAYVSQNADALADEVVAKASEWEINKARQWYADPEKESGAMGIFAPYMPGHTASNQEFAAALKRKVVGPSDMGAAGVEQGDFDSAAWDKARDDTIKASKAAGNKHLDEVPAYVESMRGKKVYYAHDNKVQGVIRTVDNRGNVYIDWSDAYSAEKEMASPTQDGKKTVMRSSIGPTDLKDYVVGEPKKAQSTATKAPNSTDVTGRPPASWVIRNKETGEVVGETFDRAKVDALNAAKYDAVPVGKHLASLNKQSKPTPGAQVEPTPTQAVETTQEGQQEEPAAEPTEVTHNGTRLYRTRINMGGEPKTMWAVESQDNKARRESGQRTIGGDSLHDTIEQAKSAAVREAKDHAERKAFAEQQDAKDKAEREAVEAKKAANRGKSIVERRKEVVLDGKHKLPASAGLGNGTRRDAMQKAVEQGRAIVERQVDDAAAKKRDQQTVDSAKRAGYILGLSNENIPVVKAGLEAQARLKANDYKKPEYRVYGGSEANGSFHEITKTEYEYAQELMAQKANKAEKMAPEDAAKYLKDFVYSLGELDGMTDRAQVALSSPLGKSGRDTLLMEAFGLTREQAHDINNRLDARQPKKLRNVDMQEAFDVFPGLRKMVDQAIQDSSKKDADSAPAPQSDDFLPDGWTKSVNGFSKRPVYRMEQDLGQPFAVVTQTEGMTYEVQIRHGDKQLTISTQRGALSEVLAVAKAELAKMTQAASVTHQDPGESPEAATKGVVADSIKTAARNEDTKPSEMRKWLLAEIDKELLQAPDRADYDSLAKGMGEKDAISMFTGNGPYGKNTETGFITFDVPGDGKFKVRNSVRGLLEFRKTVSASPGFKDNGQKTKAPEQNDGVQDGSGGKMPAILNMIEEGDFEAARDYAEAVGIKLEDVKVPRGERKPQWDQFLEDGTVPPQPDTKPQPAPKSAAELDEEKRQAREAEAKKPKDTGWNMAGTGYGGKRYRGRNITLDDGREVVARIYENAGNYEEAEVKEGSKVLLRLTDRYRAEERVDAWLDRLMGKTPALDLMGFKMEPIDDDGGFRLMDGNMVVSVERTDTGLQARHRSAKSSPRLTDQQAVEWAASIRDESKKGRVEPASESRGPAGRTYLAVPFQEKDYAKKYGAQWDEGEKLWYADPVDGDGAAAGEINPRLQRYIPNDYTAQDRYNYYGTKEVANVVAINAGARDGAQYEVVKRKHPDGMMMWSVVPANQAEAQADTPKMSQGFARGLMAWQDLGQTNGVKTHILTFYGSREDFEAKRGRMTIATVTKEVDGKNWTLDATGEKFAMLGMAKKKAEEAGMAKAIADGFVEGPFDKYAEEAKAYGYDVGQDGSVRRGDKVLGIKLKEEKGRLRVESGNGNLLFSGPQTGEALGGFLHKFYGAEKGGKSQSRDAFTLDRMNQDTGRMEPVTFQRGETVKLAIGQRPYKTGVITGISHAERTFKVDGNEYGHDFGYAYKADFDEQAQPRKEVDASLDSLEKRLDEGNAIQSEGFIRTAKETIERNNLGDYAKDRIAQLSRRAADVSNSVLDKMRAAKAEKEQAEAQKRAEEQAKSTQPKPPIEMTMEEWKAIPKDYKGTIDGQRTVMRDGGMRAVTIVKAEASESKTPTVDRHIAVMEAVRAGTATVEQFKASFDEVVANADAIKSELDTKTKAELLRFAGPFVQMRYANEKKAVVADAVYRELVGEYALGSSLTYGMGKGAYEAAVRKLVEGTDADKLAQYAKDRQAALEEAEVKRAARAEGLANPQTLNDFRSLLNVKIREGMTRKEAFLTLTPEQRIRYDELEAEGTRDTREAAKRAAKTAVRAAGQSTGGEIIATKHTRDGYDLFVVQLSDRLSREDYQTVLASAKRMGGWYSAFRGNGAIPGFQFKDRDAADAFLKLAGGDTSAAREQAAQRRDAFEDDRSQTAVERLREMADRTEDAANEELGRGRKANTERRARFASAALNAAEASKAMAKTMRNIAQAIDDGKAKFLDAVRTRTQVETLVGYVRTAKDNELRAKYPSYADQEKRKGEPATAETADFAEFPAFTAFRSDLASLGRQMLEVEGAKKLGQRLMSVADDVTDAYLDFAKQNLDRVSQFGRGDAMADFASRDMAERALKRSGLTGKAIVLPVKRGQNRVILSPSEAINRGIWQGDGDKRITLNVDFGNELVEAIGRRGNKQNGLTVPWQFQTAYDRRKALSRMGIETPSEFRSALREFIGLQERAVANRVRELELSMTGRKADGLDFFPTPAEIADQMVEAADIQPDMAVLEPSAGMGHIADRIRAAGAEPDVIEMSGDRRELLQEKGYNLSDATDFLDLKPRTFFTYGDVFRAPDGAEGIMRGAGSMGSQRVRLVNEAGDMVGAGFYDRADLTGIGHRGTMSGYDRIIMNPPFSNRRDAEHVRHAFDLLKPGGRIVAIMGEGVFFGQDKKAQDFRDWLESVGGTSEKLPDGSFLDPSLPVNTGVNARMVVIDKPAGDVAFSRSPATQAAYEARIDALFDGAAANRIGVKVLEKSDVLDMLGLGNKPMVLAEGKVILGKDNHPAMTAETWKKVPEWLENPAAVFSSDTVPGRLVFIAPDMVNGSPVRMIVEPDASVGGLQVHLMVNAFDATGRTPWIRWVGDGLTRYIDKKKFPAILAPSGLQLSRVEQVAQGTAKILTEKNLAGYRRSSEAGFSRGAGKGMPVSTAQQIVTAIRSKWANAPEVVVVASMQDPLVPEAARAEDARQKSLGATGEPEGFIYKGKVYVVAGELATPTDVIRVMFHESLGHYGLHKVFGKELGAILNQIATMRKADVKAKAEQYGLDLSDPKQRLMAAEEVLAEMAQTRPDIGFVKRAIAAIRNWLREHVPGFKDLELTDSDIIQGYILPARAYVERGAQGGRMGAQGMVPAFQRTKDQIQTEAFSKWFGDSKVVDADGKPLIGRELAVAMYERGASSATVAKAMGDVSVATVKRWVSEAGTQRTASEARGGTKENRAEAVRLYGEGLGAFAIAERLGVSNRGVYNWLRDAGVEIRSLSEAQALRAAQGRQPIRGVRSTVATKWGEIRTDSVYEAARLRQLETDQEVESVARAIESIKWGENQRYTPDFVVTMKDGSVRVEEVKPTFQQDRDDVVAKAEAARESLGSDADYKMVVTEDLASGFVALRDMAGLSFASDADRGRFKRALATAKSATGNNGNFDPANPDIRFSRSTMAEAARDALNNVREMSLPAGYTVNDLFKKTGKVSWWHKTVGTMYDLSRRSRSFARVFNSAQDFLNDVSYYATEAANKAPTILPKLESLADIAKTPITPEDNKAISAPIFEGTLTWGRDPATGKPVKMAVLEERAAQLSTQEKGQELIRRNLLDPKVLRMWQGMKEEQYTTLVENRYASDVLKPGIVFTPAELKAIFKLTDGQVKLYQEFRAAVDQSLKDMAVTDMVRFGGKDVAVVREKALAAKTVDEAAKILREFLLESAELDVARGDVLNDTANRMLDKAAKVRDLMERGYAPLSRFGQYSLDVVDENGERVYFGLFETQREANKMARQMLANYPKATINQGTVSQEAYKLFAGVSPETLELFGEMLGLESGGEGAANEAFQTYLKMAKANRSAMKRLIHRKGIAGFSEDPGRVLAGFVYSNARQAASGLHMGELDDAVSAIPKQQGELSDVAVKLRDYIKNPQEEAHQIRGLLFAQYLGGSVASAALNALQPVQVTMPWLSQYGGIKSAAVQLKQAIQDVLTKATLDPALTKALKKAEEDGIVSPQEIFHLQAQARGQSPLQSGDGTRLGDTLAKANNTMSKVSLAWGKLFGAAEQFNRRTTFIAAYRTAVAQGMANPAGFAERAVNETQFVYSKANKPQWARGAVGATLFTFKQYSISYVELMHRMWTQGGPEGKKAALLGIAVLFLVAGAGGLPFADDMDDLIDGFMQRVMGRNFNSKRAKEQFFADVLGGVFGEEAGKTGAQIMMRGISGLPGSPIDVSGRMGLGNLIPGTGIFQKKQDYTRDVMEIAGPAGDLAKRAFQAGGKALQGDVLGTHGALMTISPTAARNLGKAYEMATTGMYLDDKGKKVIDANGWEALGKSIGFQPNSVKRTQEATGDIQGMVALNRLRESEIADKWAMGVFLGDPDKVAEAKEDLAEWNTDNPDTPIRIKPMQIASRVKTMRLNKDERIAKTAPKELRGLVRAELAGVER